MCPFIGAAAGHSCLPHEGGGEPVAGLAAVFFVSSAERAPWLVRWNERLASIEAVAIGGRRRRTNSVAWRCYWWHVYHHTLRKGDCYIVGI
jgi:hypothetical protein